MRRNGCLAEVQWQQKEHGSEDGGDREKDVNRRGLGKDISKQSLPGCAKKQRLQLSFRSRLSPAPCCPVPLSRSCPRSSHHISVPRAGALPTARQGCPSLPSTWFGDLQSSLSRGYAGLLRRVALRWTRIANTNIKHHHRAECSTWV